MNTPEYAFAVRYFLQGLTLGLAYLAPIGVQNMYVINAGLTQPGKKAYHIALAIIFFDIARALACFFGVGALLEYFPVLKLGILLGGSLVLLFIGIRLIGAKTRLRNSLDARIPFPKALIMAGVVTWGNPQAIIDGSLMLGAFRATLPIRAASTFILGVASASCLWFLGITTLAILFKSTITDTLLRLINIICGMIIIAYGLQLGASFFHLLHV